MPWRLATLRELAYKTTLLGGRLDVGAGGMRVVGLLWLVAALAFGVSAGAVVSRAPWSLPLTLIVASCSLLLSIAGWPDSRIGVFVNLAILALLLVTRPGAV